MNEIAFCNLKTKCLSIKNKCGDLDENKAKLNKQLVEEILQHFEGQEHIESMKLQTIVEANMKESLRVISLLSAIRFYEQHKYLLQPVILPMLINLSRITSFINYTYKLPYN